MLKSATPMKLGKEKMLGQKKDTIKFIKTLLYQYNNNLSAPLGDRGTIWN